MVHSGGDCIVAVGNHRFGFRGSDAALILVQVEQKPAACGTKSHFDSSAAAQPFAVMPLFLLKPSIN